MDRTNKTLMPEGYLKELKRAEERKAEISQYLEKCLPERAKILLRQVAVMVIG